MRKFLLKYKALYFLEQLMLRNPYLVADNFKEIRQQVYMDSYGVGINGKDT